MSRRRLDPPAYAQETSACRHLPGSLSPQVCVAPWPCAACNSPVSDSAMIDKPEPRRFPPPWSVEDDRRLLHRPRRQRAGAHLRLFRGGAGTARRRRTCSPATRPGASPPTSQSCLASAALHTSAFGRLVLEDLTSGIRPSFETAPCRTKPGKSAAKSIVSSRLRYATASAQLMRQHHNTKKAPDQSRPGLQFVMNERSAKSDSAQSPYHKRNGAFRAETACY